MEPLKKEYKFKDFSEAMGFVTRVAICAERRDHHPDITIKYNQVILEYYTHTTNSVTEKDTALAAEIDKIARK